MERVFGRFVEGPAAFGLLLLRAGFGAGLMVHGWPKIQVPTSWRGDEIHSMMQLMGALGEFAGGLGLLLGALTPLAALGALFTMLGAWWFQHRGDPWIEPGSSSFELASLYGTFALALFLTGPGRYSIDWLVWNSIRRRENFQPE